MKKSIKPLLLLAVCMVVTNPAFALGVDRGSTGLMSLQTWLSTIVPILAAAAGSVIGVLYAKGMCGKNTMMNWVIGLTFSGASSYIASLFVG